MTDTGYRYTGTSLSRKGKIVTHGDVIYNVTDAELESFGDSLEVLPPDSEPSPADRKAERVKTGDGDVSDGDAESAADEGDSEHDDVAAEHDLNPETQCTVMQNSGVVCGRDRPCRYHD